MQAVVEQQTDQLVKDIKFHQIAAEYISRQMGNTFLVSHDGQTTSNVWWSLILAQTPEREKPFGVGRIMVDVATGKVIPLSPNEIQLLHEKVVIARATEANQLPTDEKGYVLAEYARKKADQYLRSSLSMHYGASDPILVEDNSFLWQLTIQFKMYEVGPVTLGTLDVNAITGEVIPLSTDEITRIRERTRGIIRIQAPEAATSI